MFKKIILAVLLLTTYHSNATVVLNSGESFSSSFFLPDEGEIFKVTDFFWEIHAQMSLLSDTSGELTVSVFENTDFSSQSFLAPSPINFSSLNTVFSSLIAGGDTPLFTDRTGSFIITNTGTSIIELSHIHVSNFAGNTGPTNVAYTKITPSAVPLPAAGWLMLSTLGILGMFSDKKKKPSLSAL